MNTYSSHFFFAVMGQVIYAVHVFPCFILHSFIYSSSEVGHYWQGSGRLCPRIWDSYRPAVAFGFMFWAVHSRLCMSVIGAVVLACFIGVNHRGVIHII
ncbi:hypothetical protein C8R42DRAFT_669705, partial [Lentinula raphanica]